MKGLLKRLLSGMSTAALVVLVVLLSVTAYVQDQEIQDQYLLNQKLIDYTNKGEFYIAAHHCAITQLLMKNGIIPPAPIPECVPEYLHHDGYMSPFDLRDPADPHKPAPKVEPKKLKPAVLTPLEKMNHV